jgi:AcrR family transcriptional regulator
MSPSVKASPAVASVPADEVVSAVATAPAGEASRIGDADEGRERLAEIQRARIVAGMVAVAFERGATNATVARVVARSGVSRRTFYEQFDDREACFIAAFEQGVARARSHVLEAYDPNARWAARIRTALAALLAFLDAEREPARLLVVETLAAGPRVLEHRRRVLDGLVAFVDAGRLEARSEDGPPALVAEGVVGGVLALIHARLTEADGAPLTGLLNPLVSMIVLPYLGAAAARKELKRPVASTGNRRRTAGGGDPLRDLDMRLTYRTVRVLLAIGARAGASNREVADASGIRDQGQVSKLLARLRQLGLIGNAGDPDAKGEPNAWALTAKGLEVQTAITTETGRPRQSPGGTGLPPAGAARFRDGR